MIFLGTIEESQFNSKIILNIDFEHEGLQKEKEHDMPKCGYGFSIQCFNISHVYHFGGSPLTS